MVLPSMTPFITGLVHRYELAMAMSISMKDLTPEQRNHEIEGLTALKI